MWVSGVAVLTLAGGQVLQYHALGVQATSARQTRVLAQLVDARLRRRAITIRGALRLRQIEFLVAIQQWIALVATWTTTDVTMSLDGAFGVQRARVGQAGINAVAIQASLVELALGVRGTQNFHARVVSGASHCGVTLEILATLANHRSHWQAVYYRALGVWYARMRNHAWVSTSALETRQFTRALGVDSALVGLVLF